MNVIEKTVEYVRVEMSGESSGHDWWHAWRVWQMARRLQEKEGGNLFVIELAALLHDIADHKFHGGDETIGPARARAWLEECDVEESVISQVCDIIATLSFKGAGVETRMKTIEGKIVQDADRLDAIGAIGIGRCFAYGGYKGREMYNPDIEPMLHATAEEYKSGAGTAINHFYEKLLLLRDRMNTESARTIAEGRHAYMEEFLEQFQHEWNGEK